MNPRFLKITLYFYISLSIQTTLICSAKNIDCILTVGQGLGLDTVETRTKTGFLSGEYLQVCK